VSILTGLSWRDDPYTFRALRAGLVVLLDALPTVLAGLEPEGELRVPERVTKLYAGSASAEALQDPIGLGTRLALGICDQLRLLPTRLPLPSETPVQFADSFRELVDIKHDLNPGEPS
jgi:hypothetical protein